MFFDEQIRARQHGFQKQNRIFLLPHTALQPYIAHYTITFAEKSQEAKDLMLIPDASGCMVFSLSSTGWVEKYWGPTTKCVRVQDDYQRVKLRFFVEFLPSGAFYFTGIPQRELQDQQILLEDLNKKFSRQCTAILDKATSVSKLVEQFDQLFLQALRIIKQPEQMITSLLPRFQTQIVTVQDASLLSGYSERHLNRLFHRVLGMNMKTYLRLLRVNQALQHIQAEACSMTHLAQSLSYFDQAHFIHDFKRVCGVTPSSYLQNMSFFYNEEYKF